MTFQHDRPCNMTDRPQPASYTDSDGPSTPALSIIVPTLGRAPLLARCLDAVAANTRADHEIIIVAVEDDLETINLVNSRAAADHPAHADADAAPRTHSRIRLICQPQANGFVAAANEGFAAATGECITWLNDDARPLPGCYDIALQAWRHRHPDVGLLALFHRIDVTRSIACETYRMGQPYRLMHVRGTLYANFGLTSRQLLDDVGRFTPAYRMYAADPDFSLKIWKAGYAVAPAWGAMIDHDEHEDAHRRDHSAQRDQDNAAFFDAWLLPPRNPHVNDFDPAQPCTLPRSIARLGR